MPETAMVCGLPAPVSLTDKVAERKSCTLGVKRDRNDAGGAVGERGGKRAARAGLCKVGRICARKGNRIDRDRSSAVVTMERNRLAETGLPDTDLAEGKRRRKQRNRGRSGWRNFGYKGVPDAIQERALHRPQYREVGMSWFPRHRRSPRRRLHGNAIGQVGSDLPPKYVE